MLLRQHAAALPASRLHRQRRPRRAAAPGLAPPAAPPRHPAAAPSPLGTCRSPPPPMLPAAAAGGSLGAPGVRVRSRWAKEGRKRGSRAAMASRALQESSQWVWRAHRARPADGAFHAALSWLWAAPASLPGAAAHSRSPLLRGPTPGAACCSRFFTMAVDQLPRRIIKVRGAQAGPRGPLRSTAARLAPPAAPPSLPRCLQETQRLLSEPVPGISAAPSEENLVSRCSQYAGRSGRRLAAAALERPAGALAPAGLLHGWRCMHAMQCMVARVQTPWRQLPTSHSLAPSAPARPTSPCAALFQCDHSGP